MKNKATVVSLLGAAVLQLVSTTGAAALESKGSYDITNCWGGTSKGVVQRKEQIARSVHLTGTSRSNVEGGTFDKMSFQCVGVSRVVKGTPTGDGECEYLDADGDKMFATYEHSDAAGGKWRFVNGTGKFTGISGGGKFEYVDGFPTIDKAQFKGCERATGSYELK